MKDITLFINEAVSKKFDYWEDVIQFPGYELKVPKNILKKKSIVQDIIKKIF